MNDKEMKQIVLNYIRKNGGTSYAEIERVFDEHGYNYKGKLEAVSGTNSNVVFWCGWNKQAFDIIKELIKDNLIERVPCKNLVYLIDGKGLNYPVLNSATTSLKSVHWLPCVFNAL